MAVNKVMLKSGKVLMDTSGVTVEPGMLYKGKTALNREGKLIEGTLEPGVANEVEQAVPQITVSAEGLVVAYATQEGGYVAAGTARSEMQLPVQAGKNVMPSVADQVAVEDGKYTTGAVTVKGDENLKAENIAEGVSIFGVIGSLRKEDQPDIEGVEQAVPVIEVLPGGMITATAEQTAGYVAGGIKQAKMQLPVQAGKDVVPSMADQVAVEAGKYTTGAIMVKGDENLKAENIAEGVSIFGVIGSLRKEDQPDIEGVEQAVPVIEVLPGGMITATAEQTAGYVAGGIKQAKMQLPVQAGKDVVPSMADQVAVEAGKYTTGAIMVKGDENLVPDNIAEGVSIFGVLGAFAGGGGGMSKFGGYPCETGTCIMTNGSCTIPHSLGTLKGAILMSQGKINGYTLVIVTLENTFNVALYSDGSGGDAMNSSMFSENFWITANNTNSATIKLDMFFADAQNMNYILLGA